MGVVILSVVAVAMFVFTRNETKAPVRYRSEALIEVPVRANPNARNSDNQNVNVAGPEVPRQLLVSQTRMALSAGVRTAAIANSGLDPAPAAAFGAVMNPGLDSMTLSITTRDQAASEALLSSYIGAFQDAREKVSADDVTGEQRSIISNLEVSRNRLADVESELRGVEISDVPTANTGNDNNNNNQAQAPAITDDLPLGTTLLIFERSALRAKITALQVRYADLAVNGAASSYASVIDRGLPHQIQAATPSPLVPAAGILLGGLVLGLLAAIFTDRLDHTIRNAKSAAKAFKAPVLCTIPAARRGHGGHSVLRDPRSARSQAFRALAATSVATDRLPRAIMITTPAGDVHEEVATNFAAALAGLGLRVALIATSPDQAWFLGPFKEPEGGSTNLPELLELAHAGRLNGQVRTRLPVSELGPNLVVIPPGTDRGLALPFDGLPPLLDALVRAGIDVAVIAGPALLENADATIVAWATRAVLWAVQAGEVTEEDASLAAARLDLAGVESFGVALIGEET